MEIVRMQTCQYRNCDKQFPFEEYAHGIIKLYCSRSHKKKEQEFRNGTRKSVKTVVKKRSKARKLDRGERISDYFDLHKGIQGKKDSLGNPKPEGLTLSLICTPETCADNYLVKSKRDKSLRGCIHHEHYVYETMDQNRARSI